MTTVTTGFRARVRGGRLVLDEPTDLPEGTTVTLVPIDEDEPGAGDAAAIDEAWRTELASRIAQLESGEVEPETWDVVREKARAVLRR